jgi:hypothetical protein
MFHSGFGGTERQAWGAPAGCSLQSSSYPHRHFAILSFKEQSDVTGLVQRLAASSKAFIPWAAVGRQAEPAFNSDR